MAPLQDIQLAPGVNAQVTLAQNQAGISVSNLLRFKNSLAQKLGGWAPLYPFPVSTGPIRDIHAFQGLRSETHYVGVGGLGQLSVISLSTQGSSLSTLIDITPQAFQTNSTASLSVVSGSSIVQVNDTGSSMSVYGAIRFDTPVAIAGMLLNGAYPINSVLSQDIYTISGPSVSSATISSGGILPKFYTSSGSALVGVLLPNNNFLSAIGLYYPFTAPTSVGGITIQGPYPVTSIVDSTNFFIGSPVPAVTTVSSASPVTMNSSLFSIYHYVALGPPQIGGVYGAGIYGAGLYGLGLPLVAGASSKITATDWLLDNWGAVLIAAQQNGPIYTWAPDTGLNNAVPITQGGAPIFCLGAFVSVPIQILFAWGCATTTGQQDQLLIRWSDTGAQQGYNQWIASTQNFAGTFRIPTGSTLRAAMQAPLYAVFWTDIDVWVAQYVGYPIVWSFQRMGGGCGAIGPHAMDIQGGVVYWASQSNFYRLAEGGVQVVPCSVWDFFFQQLDLANASKVRCASNSIFNEITWYFPVIGGNGENSAYVKVHIEGQEFEWDYGFLDRTAWEDVTAVGMPIGSDQGGMLWRHEVSPDAGGIVLNGALETGYFELGDGSALVMIDWVLPDAKWNVFGGSTGTLIFTFFTVDYTGQPERTYGPYAVTQDIPYINTRMRGRYWRARVESQDLGSFWRVGRVKFRWQYAGTR